VSSIECESDTPKRTYGSHIAYRQSLPFFPPFDTLSSQTQTTVLFPQMPTSYVWGAFLCRADFDKENVKTEDSISHNEPEQ
jgi:hypothetical protein